MRISKRVSMAMVVAGGALVGVAAQQGCTRTTTGEPVAIVQSAVVTKYDWLQFGGGSSHSGNNTHKVNVGDGSEVTGGGWPELATLKTSVEKDGTALTIGTSGGVNYLYLGAGGYDGDGGNYQGHVTTVNLGTGAQKVFNGMCS